MRRSSLPKAVGGGTSGRRGHGKTGGRHCAVAGALSAFLQVGVDGERPDGRRVCPGRPGDPAPGRMVLARSLSFTAPPKGDVRVPRGLYGLSCRVGDIGSRFRAPAADGGGFPRPRFPLRLDGPEHPGGGERLRRGLGREECRLPFPVRNVGRTEEPVRPPGNSDERGPLAPPLARNGGEVRKESPERCRKREGRQGGICNGIRKWKKGALLFVCIVRRYLKMGRCGA